ncbi:MAG: RNA-directed DNA polymerase [Polyangiaceae bacterium]|nr:RNA-directed DNA polymerase [Polyangiaceae bacterium]
MTAPFDPHLPADSPVRAEPRSTTRRSPEETAKLAAVRAERVALWKAIEEAGGIAAWVRAEIAKKGISTDGVDPSTLSDRQKSSFKDKKRAESEARRTFKRLAWDAYKETHITHLGGIYWDEDASPDKFDIDGREERAKDNILTDIQSPGALAQALGLTVAKLRWLTFHRDVDSGTHYRRWQIPKRDGSMRTITAPKLHMKTAQRWALRNVFDKLPVHGAAHGFLAARSIVTNASVHAGADVVVKIDIEEFFPTITFRRVKGLLRKAGLSEQAATLIALLCTEPPRESVNFRGKTVYVASGPRALPQGAPTSPAITNALCRRMDLRLSGLARLLGLKYTRYADDLTFSWKCPTPGAKAPLGVLLRGVTTILKSEGFRIHKKKTSIMRKGARQAVTGLIINSEVGAASARVPRDVIRNLRAAIKNRELGRPGKEGETLAQLQGLAAFVYMSDPVKGRTFLDRIAKLQAPTKT